MSDVIFQETLDTEHELIGEEESLGSWVQAKVDKWREYYDSNYREKDDEYYRIWRGIWAEEDKQRESERSKIISPATQQAVESNVAEVEEATFGRGTWFRLDDDVRDEEKQDIALLERLLKEEFKKNKVRKQAAECVLNAAVFGCGVAEVVVTSKEDRSMATQDQGGYVAVGANVGETTCVELRPVGIRNFLYDPAGADVESCLGVAIDEFVPRHQVEILQEKKVYRDLYLGDAATEESIEADKELSHNAEEGRVRLVKYFGKIPSYLLKKFEDDEGIESLTEDEDESMYVEAIVVLGNGHILKAEKNPYIMQDRPIVAFSWDTVPGRFRGRGVVELGYNTQKAIDAELRSRIDGLALTTHPMLAMDARRLPRGGDFRVRPGKTILTQGDPREILHSFHFGEMSQNTFAQTASLERMHQSATSAADSSGVAGGINNEATAAGISMSLGAIIKRQKRTLLNFQECFLIPFVEKAAWRYMQYEPEKFPVGDYRFMTCTSLGIMAREYEVSQLVQLLQTVSPDSPVYVPLLTSIIDNMNLSEREQLIATLNQANQPSPEQQEAQQKAQQMQEARQMAEIEMIKGQAGEFNARANKLSVEAQLEPLRAEADLMEAMEDTESKDLNKRLAITDRRLKEKELNIKAEGARNANTTRER